jgi:prepilin-type N-terminal cleavage/methylation domain-containing protein
VIEQSEVSESSNDRDRGFTLIEILIVISMMAVLTGVLAATVTVVLRTAPMSEVRADDARTVRGLVTWLPEDVDAAPPSGFDTANTAWPCAGSAPADSYNVLAISWTERTDITHNYAATYRYESDGSKSYITRYTCNDETDPTMPVGRRHNLTSGLPPWNDAVRPAYVTMCSAQVDKDTGECLADDEITSNTSPDVRSIKLHLTRPDGVVITIDAAPKNPDEGLADDPTASINLIPEVSQTDHALDLFAGQTVTIDLNTTHNPSDADGDTLSVAIDISEPMPPGITASTTDPLNVTITAGPGLPIGPISPPLVLVISDPRAGWVDATVTVNIVLPPPNVAPSLSPSTYNLDIAPGEAVILSLDASHGATDANGDPLTATVQGWPNKVFPPTTGGSTDPLDIRIEAKSSALTEDGLEPITVLIEDGRGGSVEATITLTIVSPAPNNAPTVTSSDVAVSMNAGDTVTLFLDASHGASDPDGDPLSVDIDAAEAQPAGVTTALPGALEVTLTADPSIAEGPTIPVSLTIEDGRGGSVDATITITIAPRPPPPSDCVLGNVSADPGMVANDGDGDDAKLLKKDVTVTLTYTGSCDGLVLRYDTGDTSGLGVGVGRVFPPGSPSSVVINGRKSGGNEKWRSGTYTLTASTTSEVTATAVTTTLTVT